MRRMKRQIRDRRRQIVRSALAAAALLAAASCAAAQATPTRSTSAALRGFPLAVPVARPQVTLTGTSGRPYPFADRTHGRVTLVYLGYTHCTDTCPAMMADVAVAVRHLPQDVARKVTVVFITTDPRRDTPRVIRTWLDRFDPSFVGLTGTPAALAASYRAFGVDPKVVLKPDGAEQVEHSADMYAFGPDDQAHISYDPSSTPPDYEHDLPLLARGVTPPVPTAADLAADGGTGRAGLLKAFSAYLSPTVAGRTALSVTLANGGEGADTLVGAGTADGGRGSLRAHARPVQALTVTPQSTLAVHPGDPAEIWLSGLPQALRRGDVAVVSLQFRDAGTLTMRVAVVNSPVG